MGLLRMATRTAVVAGTATAVSNRVSRRQAGRWQQKEEEQAAQEPQQAAPPPAPAAPAAPQDPDVAKLQELAQLHSQGVLSDEEFAAAKAKVLGL
jgi:hypothetical protein